MGRNWARSADADEYAADYAAHLEERGYAHKTLSNELTTLKQATRWLISAGHLRGMKPIELKLRKAESESAHCYRAEEARAILEHCRQNDPLQWLGDLIIALACTGLRIAELASLRWSDIDFEKVRLTLTDETGRSQKPDRSRRQLNSGRSRSFPIHPEPLSYGEKRRAANGRMRKWRRGFHSPGQFRDNQGRSKKQRLATV